MAGQPGLCIAQTVLVPAYTDLYNRIKKLVKTSKQFRDLTKEIKQKCELFQKLIQELEDLNTGLEISNGNLNSFREKIEKSSELLSKCSKVRWWEFRKQYKYTTKLQKLDTVLNTWPEILRFELVRDGKLQLKAREEYSSKKKASEEYCSTKKASEESWVKRLKDWVKSIFSTVAAWVKRLLSVLKII